MTGIPVTITSQTGLTAPQKPPVISLHTDEMISDDEEFEDALDEGGVIKHKKSHPFGPSYRFVSTMGLDAQRMQVMKASFFDELEPTQPQRPVLKPVKPVLGSSIEFGVPQSRLVHPFHSDHVPQQQYFPRPSVETLRSVSIPNSPIQMKPSTEETVPNFESYTTHPSMKVQSETQSALLLPRHALHCIVPLKASLSNNRLGLFADLGIFLGRSFRVGWGPNWTLAHSGYSLTNQVTQRPHPHGIFSPLSTLGDSEDSDDNGLKIRAVLEKVDASPWMKQELISPDSQSVCTCIMYIIVSYPAFHSNYSLIPSLSFYINYSLIPTLSILYKL